MELARSTTLEKYTNNIDSIFYLTNVVSRCVRTKWPSINGQKSKIERSLFVNTIHQNWKFIAVLSSQNGNYHFRAHFALDGVDCRVCISMKITMSAKIIIKINVVPYAFTIFSIYLEIFDYKAEPSNVEQKTE